MNDLHYRILVTVTTNYLPEQSLPDRQRYAFAYHVCIRNAGAIAAQLRTRHWIIRDADGREEEVRGPGVVGEQPLLEPGDEFEYTSGAVIRTQVGTMHGSYQMVATDGHLFDAQIPQFTLSVPRVLH
jgi:ApaG protein